MDQRLITSKESGEALKRFTIGTFTGISMKKVQLCRWRKD
jgi:hypothetical protein